MEALRGDKITDSMRPTLDETERRRAKQIAFNPANGIASIIVKKAIKEMIDGVYSPQAAHEMHEEAKETAKVESMSEKQISKEIKRLEKAGQVRDKLHIFKQQAFGAPGTDNAVSMLGK